MTHVGFEPTHLALVELESTPLDHSGKVSQLISALRFITLRSTKEKEAGRQAIIIEKTKRSNLRNTHPKS